MLVGARSSRPRRRRTGGGGIWGLRRIVLGGGVGHTAVHKLGLATPVGLLLLLQPRLDLRTEGDAALLLLAMLRVVTTQSN